MYTTIRENSLGTYVVSQEYKGISDDKIRDRLMERLTKKQNAIKGMLLLESNWFNVKCVTPIFEIKEENLIHPDTKMKLMRLTMLTRVDIETRKWI